MTRSDNTIDNMVAEAERLGKENEAIEKRNQKRRAKGRPPLPDPQEAKDMEVRKRRYRTGDATTVNGEDAMKLFELRKAEMSGGDDGYDDDLDDVPEDPPKAPPKGRRKASPAQAPASPHPEVSEEDAAREAAAARRIQDMKNGRIDHEGNWSPQGQSLEGGDATVVVDKTEVSRIWGLDQEAPAQGEKDANGEAGAVAGGMDFVADLYRRLGTSFEALERTLSDLQGRVSEIVTATTPQEPEKPDMDGKATQFQELLSKSTPVTFEVEGTKMSFDAITVFHAPPCITVVSKIGSAKITPKPGARLLMSYEMDGEEYDRDPVVYLGTRFDIPMFGLSFVGFIRDIEAGLMDAAAGVSE